MEIVLQWLDELDDFVFAGILFWRRLRRLCLAIAFSAALGLHALRTLDIAGDGLLLALVELSCGALAVWAVFAVLSARADRSFAVVTGRA